MSLGLWIAGMLVILALTTLGCDSRETEPPSAHRHCDYCKEDRDAVRGYPCRSCKGMHWSCRIERPLQSAGWDTVWVVACPQKETAKEKE